MVEYGAEVQQREISHANNNKTVQTACGTNSPADLSASCGTYGRAVGLYARLNKGVENKIKKRKKYPPLSTYPPLFYPDQTALHPTSPRRQPVASCSTLLNFYNARYTNVNKKCCPCSESTAGRRRAQGWGRYFTGLEFLAKSALSTFNIVVYFSTRWLTVLCTLEYL